jgi:hypothetical protein
MTIFKANKNGHFSDFLSEVLGLGIFSHDKKKSSDFSESNKCK